MSHTTLIHKHRCLKTGAVPQGCADGGFANSCLISQHYDSRKLNVNDEKYQTSSAELLPVNISGSFVSVFLNLLLSLSHMGWETTSSHAERVTNCVCQTHQIFFFTEVIVGLSGAEIMSSQALPFLSQQSDSIQQQFSECKHAEIWALSPSYHWHLGSLALSSPPPFSRCFILYFCLFDMPVYPAVVASAETLPLAVTLISPFLSFFHPS